jgi:hypothetical protein
MHIQDHLQISVRAAHLLTPNLARIFIVANNPAIDSHIFGLLQISQQDLLVQFNKPAHFNVLAPLLCHKLHFHNRNHKGSCWGFQADGRPECDLTAQFYESLTFATTDFIPEPIQVYLDGLGGNVHRLAISSQDIALYCYPPSKMPSAGFTAVSFFRSLNWIRQCHGLKPVHLTIVGFTGIYPPGKAWCGHDFAFEQHAYRLWVDVRKLDARGVELRDWQDGRGAETSPQ